MDTEVARDFAFDVVEKAAELNRTMPAVKFSNHLATGDIERGEERDAIEAVITKTLESTPRDATHWGVRAPCPRPAG